MAKQVITLGEDRLKELQSICNNWLLKDLNEDKITLIDVAVIAELMKLAETAVEAGMIMYGLTKDYPGLAIAMEQAAGVKQQETEVDMQAVVNLVIKQDPLLAADVAKVAMKPGMTMAKLEDQFPKIKEYLS